MFLTQNSCPTCADMQCPRTESQCLLIFCHSFVGMAASSGRIHAEICRYGSRYLNRKKLLYNQSWIVSVTLYAVTLSLEANKNLHNSQHLLPTEEWYKESCTKCYLFPGKCKDPKIGTVSCHKQRTVPKNQKISKGTTASVLCTSLYSKYLIQVL